MASSEALRNSVAKKIARPLEKSEIARAAETLALAFVDEPLFHWFANENESKRHAILRWFHESSLIECHGVGGAFTLEDEGPDSCALGLVPAGRWPIPFMKTLGAVVIPGFFPTYRFARWGLHIENAIRTRHPKEDHVYIAVIGVHPKKKGTGLGGALMHHACTLGIESNAPVYLETGNPINLPFYRRFGLDVTTEITSHGGPPIWTMTSVRDDV